mmetsp:Transcript_15623/g.33838  ORF Transcript_15623/g.33838 Transcript_15623/m.33838 type:complete len:106 (+) Transcript_15623:329-646(+)|eukprot:CAMPEP_0172310590 /NCGR_PEP_ID=MMETSP1058-20130122/11905_1 /TAXON_ID=83371 /ORGANISM="Detonula confervacea, Strain CCMP 353" /LENGTH=105 /DNA_ID=CAMNT_0013023439 /DNA_START=275 /DNA_END=595 /DNA_ORIENTATION=+
MSTLDYIDDDESWCIMDEMEDVYISHSEEEPLSWKEAMWQPFLSCGLCSDDDEEEDSSQKEAVGADADWGTLIWHLSGMEFIRLSCIEPDVLESFGNDKIIISGM